MIAPWSRSAPPASAHFVCSACGRLVNHGLFHEGLWREPPPGWLAWWRGRWAPRGAVSLKARMVCGRKCAATAAKAEAAVMEVLKGERR